MNVGARRHGDQFPNYVVNELVRDFLVHSQTAEAHLYPCMGFGRLCSAVQFRVGHHGRIDVARHVDFRHNRDIAILGILDDLFVFFLRIETAGSATHLGQAADLGQFRP